MQIKKMLNSKDTKKIEEMLKQNYLCDIRLRDYFVFINVDDKIWIASKDILKYDLGQIKRINLMGMYFGRLKRNNKIQLSIEGSQLVGKTAKKNIAIVDEENMKKFMYGSNVAGELVNCELNNFVLIKYGNDFLSCGVLREDKIENILPRSRRLL